MNHLIAIIKSNLFIQNAVSWVVSHFPFVAEHNIGKYLAIKKALYLTALDRTEGDYLEFGVFTGSSFVCAMRCHRLLKDLGDMKTRFLGFDSFTGFGRVDAHDEHPFYTDNMFRVDAEKIIRNIHKKGKGLSVTITKGFFVDTVGGKNCKKDFGVESIRCLFIDCDMKEPSAIALAFSAPAIVPGSIIIFDDFFSYKGDNAKGVAGAFEEFKVTHPEFSFRKLYDYGYGGVAFIVSEIRR